MNMTAANYQNFIHNSASVNSFSAMPKDGHNAEVSGKEANNTNAEESFVSIQGENLPTMRDMARAADIKFTKPQNENSNTTEDMEKTANAGVSSTGSKTMNCLAIAALAAVAGVAAIPASVEISIMLVMAAAGATALGALQLADGISYDLPEIKKRAYM